MSNTDFVSAAKYFCILFRTLYIVEFALSHFTWKDPVISSDKGER